MHNISVRWSWPHWAAAAALTLAAAPAFCADNPAGLRVFPSGGLRGESAALAFKGQQGGTLQFELLALPVPFDADAGVPVVLEVLGGDLLEQASDKARVEVALFAVSEEGAVGASLLRVVEIDLATHHDRLAASGVKLLARLPLGAGRWTLRAFVRSLAPGGRVSLRVQPLLIESNPANATISPPVVWDDASRWLVAALDEGGSTWLASGERLPSARPLVASGAMLAATVAVRQLNPRARLEVRIVDAGGNEVEQRRFEGAKRVRGLAVGVELVEGTIDLGGLPPGDLQLQVVAQTPQDMVAGSAGVAFGATGLPIAVASGALPEGIAVWAELFGGAGRQPSAGESTAVASTSAKLAIARAELDAGLRAAFELVVAGRDGDARLALVDLETRALDGSGGAVPTLAKAELALCRDLAKRDPEAIVPLALLWLDVYRAERARQGFLLSTHARTMVSSLVDLYVASGSGEGSKHLGARILAVLGAELQSVGLTRLATTTLDRSLALDPANELAALALSAELERRQATADMLTRLQVLVAAQPDHREASLRLGIAELRLGRDGAGRERLGRLLSPEAPADWIYAVAAQELVRLDIRGKQFERAEATAKSALERLAGNEKLSLALAALEDRLGRAGASRSRLEAIPRAERSGVGERARYGEPPRDALARVEREVRDSAKPRRDRLAAALGVAVRGVAAGGDAATAPATGEETSP